MKPNQRQKTLGFVLGGVLLWIVGDRLLEQWILNPLDEKQRKLGSLQVDVAGKQQELLRVKRLVRTLQDVESSALPSDPAIAATLYQAWLIDLMDELGIHALQITPGRSLQEEELGYRLPFTVRADLREEQLWQLLERIQALPVQHGIPAIVLRKDGPEGDLLQMTMTLEAVALAGVEQSEDYDLSKLLPRDRQTPEEVSERMAQARLFTPDLPKSNPVAPSNDSVKPPHEQLNVPQAPNYRLVAVLSRNGRPEAWFVDSHTSQKQMLQVGDSLAFANVAAEIVAIQPQRIVVDRDGETCALRLGQPIDAIQPERTQERTVATFRR